jgi:c(7)-type cytochrome triheme protein
MKITIILVSILVAFAFVGTSIALPPGKTAVYPDGAMGKVTFSGDVHGMKQGMKCTDCHPKIFAMKKESFKETKEDHGKDVYCGVCHNGTKAFSQTDAKNCGKCHKKGEEEAPKPEVSQPEVSQPETPQPEVSQPEATQPETPKEEMK